MMEKLEVEIKSMEESRLRKNILFYRYQTTPGKALKIKMINHHQITLRDFDFDDKSKR